MLLLEGSSGWFEIDETDLTGVRAIVLTAGWQDAPKAPYNFKVHLNSPDGEIIGSSTLSVQSPGTPGAAIVMPLSKVANGKHKLVITAAVEKGQEPSPVALVNASFN